jgi:hypothetical protein
MTKPKITFATNPNPRNRALIDGLIPLDGYDLNTSAISTRRGRCIIGLSRVSSTLPRCRPRR